MKYVTLSSVILAFLISCIPPMDATKSTLHEQDSTIWREIPSHADVSPVKTMRLEPSVEFYGASPTGTLFFFLGRQELKLTINCNIERLNPLFPLTSMKLCYNNCSYMKKNRTDQCPNMNCVKLSTSKRKMDFLNLKWNASYDPLYGGNVTIHIASSTQFPNVTLHCQAQNVKGSVNSSELEIINYKPVFPSVISHSNQGKIVPERSMRLKCTHFSSNIALYRPLIFTWYVSDQSAEDLILEPKGKALMDIFPFKKWPVQILNNGSLYWPFVSREAQRKLEGKRLFCKIEDILVGIYTNTLEFEKSDAANEENVYRPLHTRVSHIYSWVYISEKERVILYCPSEGGGRGTYDIIWKRDGLVFPEGRNEIEGIENRGGYLIIFKSYNGTRWFKCQVNLKSSSIKIIDNVTISYELEHIHVPEMEYVPQYLFVLNGNNLSIDCALKDREAEYILTINGEQKELLENAKKMHLSTNSYMMVTPPFKFQSVFSNITESSFFTVGCGFRTNHQLPMSWRQFLVNVLPPIRYSRTPSDTVCEHCDICINSQFFCEINGTSQLLQHPNLNFIFIWTFIKSNGIELGVEAFPEIFYVEKKGRHGTKISILTPEDIESAKLILGVQNKSISFILRCSVFIRYKGPFYEDSIYNSSQYENDDIKISLQSSIKGTFDSCTVCNRSCFITAAVGLFVIVAMFLMLAGFILEQSSSPVIVDRRVSRSRSIVSSQSMMRGSMMSGSRMSNTQPRFSTSRGSSMWESFFSSEIYGDTLATPKFRLSREASQNTTLHTFVKNMSERMSLLKPNTSIRKTSRTQQRRKRSSSRKSSSRRRSRSRSQQRAKQTQRPCKPNMPKDSVRFDSEKMKKVLQKQGKYSSSETKRQSGKESRPQAVKQMLQRVVSLNKESIAQQRSPNTPTEGQAKNSKEKKSKFRKNE